MATGPCSGANDTTECWLRELWKQQEKPDWDDETFAFTVIFTILAFVVAWVTIFQGAIFAGSGRLKASRRAIGDFNKYTSKWYRQYSLSESRFRTTTKVPFFRFPPIGKPSQISSQAGTWWKDATDHCQKQPQPGNNVLRKPSLSRRAPTSNDNTSPASTPSKSETDLELGPQTDRKLTMVPSRYAEDKPAVGYAASWANLLESFDSSLLLFERGSPKDGYNLLLFCDTEFIPDDVSAAPAIGNVQTIMTMAALAGCDMIKYGTGKDLPTARGPNVQLIFREHPQLGDIASFQRFPGPEAFYQKRDIPSLINECFLTYHLGGVPYVNPDAYEYLALLSSNLGWPRASAFSKSRLHKIMQDLCSHSRSWETKDIGVIMTSLLQHFKKTSTQLYWMVDDYAGLTMKSWPRDASFKFSYSDMTLAPLEDQRPGGRQSPGAQFVPTGPGWPSASYQRTERPMMETVRLEQPEEVLIELDLFRDEFLDQTIMKGGHWTAEGDPPIEVPPSGNAAVVIIPLAMFTCIRFIAKNTALDNLELYDKAAIRGALRWQLNELDSYLSVGGAPVTALEQLYMENSPLGGVPDSKLYTLDEEIPKASSLQEATVFLSNAKQQEEPIQRETLRYYRDVLVFRAVVMAAFLSTAADLSDVIGTEIGKQVVQFV